MVVRGTAVVVVEVVEVVELLEVVVEALAWAPLAWTIDPPPVAGLRGGRIVPPMPCGVGRAAAAGAGELDEMAEATANAPPPTTTTTPASTATRRRRYLRGSGRRCRLRGDDVLTASGGSRPA